MADPPNKMASVTVDELLGIAHDAYARARVSPDASTKQQLTRLADDYLKRAKDMCGEDMPTVFPKRDKHI
jgi:hypothetical protein